MTAPPNFPKTMYEQNPEVFERAIQKGHVNIAAAAKVTYTVKQLDDAVGSKSGGAVSHWLRGDPTGPKTERNAKLYMESLNKTPEQPVLELIPMVKPKPEQATFMVNVPVEYLEKWQALVEIIKTKGCQVAAF